METEKNWIFSTNGTSELVELHTCWMAFLIKGSFESLFSGCWPSAVPLWPIVGMAAWISCPFHTTVPLAWGV